MKEHPNLIGLGIFTLYICALGVLGYFLNTTWVIFGLLPLAWGTKKFPWREEGFISLNYVGGFIMCMCVILCGFMNILTKELFFPLILGLFFMQSFSLKYPWDVQEPATLNLAGYGTLALGATFVLYSGIAITGIAILWAFIPLLAFHDEFVWEHSIGFRRRLFARQWFEKTADV